MSPTPDETSSSSDEPSPQSTPERYVMTKKQRIEKWKRVGQYGGVGLLEKARARLARLNASENTTSTPNPPTPESVAEPAPKVSKQPAPKRAPSKIVKPATSRPPPRPAALLPNNLDDGSAARAIGAARIQQRRPLPPKGLFSAPQPGLRRVIPVPVAVPPPQKYTNPLASAYWQGLGYVERVGNPLQLPVEERVGEWVRRGEVGYYQR